MDRESAILLQMIDANCNECKHLERDFVKFKKWEDLARIDQLEIFERKKAAAFQAVEDCPDPIGKKSLLFIANKMRFIFSREHLISYGNCFKFNKPVSFIPDVCQLETQQCFNHRRK